MNLNISHLGLSLKLLQARFLVTERNSIACQRFYSLDLNSLEIPEAHRLANYLGTDLTVNRPPLFLKSQNYLQLFSTRSSVSAPNQLFYLSFGKNFIFLVFSLTNFLLFPHLYI